MLIPTNAAMPAASVTSPELDRPPGPTASRFQQSLRWLRDPAAFLTECATQFGDAFTLRFAGTPPWVVVWRAQDVERLARGHGLSAAAANAVLAGPLGTRSVLLLEGSEHATVRRALANSLSPARIASLLPLLETVVERQIRSWPVGSPVSLHRCIQRLTLEAIAATLFGDVPGRDTICNLATLYGERLGAMGWQPAARRARRANLESLTVAGGQLRETAVALLRRLPESSDGILLDLRARLRAAGCPDTALHDQLLTLLVSGHESTALVLTWAVYRLSRNAELARLLLTGDGDGTLLDAVIAETLRLHAPFMMVPRVATDPFPVREHRAERGDVVAASTFLSHRDPSVFADPERFDPERFLREAPSTYAYYPFGLGPRRCVGMHLATLEMRLVLPLLLLRRRVVPADNTEPQSTRRGLGLAPADGITVRFERRSRRRLRLRQSPAA